jgi:hypothetical protein
MDALSGGEALFDQLPCLRDGLPLELPSLVRLGEAAPDIFVLGSGDLGSDRDR